MIKLLPVILIVIIVGGFLFVKLRPQPQIQPISLPEKISDTFSSDSSLEERVKSLETAVTALLKQVGTSNIKTPTGSTTSIDSKITAIESNISNLQTRVNNLEKGSTTQTTQTTSISKSPIFIPLGSGSNSTSDWTSISGTAITINASDYSGYTSMQIQTSLNVFQTGIAYARLYNSDNGTSFGEVSTSSTTDTVLTSGTFTLPSGSKTYVLQIKSQTSGYAATASNAKIKVNF